MADRLKLLELNTCKRWMANGRRIQLNMLTRAASETIRDITGHGGECKTLSADMYVEPVASRLFHIATSDIEHQIELASR